MKTIRQRFKGKFPLCELPYVDLGDDWAAELGLAPGRYVQVDAIAIVADTLNSDDLKFLWECVAGWTGVADEAARFLEGA